MKNSKYIILFLVSFFLSSIEISAQPDDPFFENQYYLNQVNDVDINALEAWDITTGDATIRVAFIGNGIEANHEDFLDLTGNSNVVNGFSPDGGTGLLFNDNSHEQACAGIVGARHNDQGISGIAPNVEIVPINLLAECDSYSNGAECIRDAIFWAADNNVDIINISQTFAGSDPCNPTTANMNTINSAIDYALEQGRNGKGCIILAGVGNNGIPCISYPASYPGVIAVGAIDRDGDHSEYSHTGMELDFVTPSSPGTATTVIPNGDVWTLDFMNEGNQDDHYRDNFGGTSGACAIGSGVAALILSESPSFTYEEVYQLMKVTAKDQGAIGWDDEFGYGIMDAFATVEEANTYASCGNTISDYPHKESFESSNHSWNQHIFEDLDWTQKAGNTPSSNTGPSKASDGSYYFYIESSNNNVGYPYKISRITSPCYDFSQLDWNEKKISFDYHMYGSTMGGLGLRVSDDGGRTWSTLWVESGDQGNNWFSKQFILSGYNSSEVKFQFIGVTGNSWRSDMAIDNIVVGVASQPNVFITNASVNYPSAQQGQTVNVSLRQNMSPASAPYANCRVEYWFSNNSTWSTNDTYLGSDYSSIGNGDANDYESLTFNIPSNAPPGTRYIILQCDAFDIVDESNEIDNTTVVPISITASSQLPNVFISNESISDNTVYVGQNVQVTLRQNMSPSSAPYVSSRVEYYLSTNTTHSNDDIYLGSDNSTIGGGDAYDSESISFSVPSIASGTRYILVKCDVFNAVNESNENDNLESIAISVVNNGQSNPVSSNSTIESGNVSNLDTRVHSDLNEIRVFPNPASNIVNVEIPETYRARDGVYLCVYSNKGELLRKINLDKVDSSTHTFDISDLTPSVYHLRLVSPQKSSSVKFVVAK